MSDFIVPAIAPRIRHIASGTAEERRLFPFPFPAAAASDIAVYRDGAALDGGYTVAFSADRQGGTVTLDIAAPDGAEIVIRRSTPIERATDFVENGAFRAASLNLELDRLTMIAQELDLAGRAGLHRDPSEVGPDLVLPAPVARANGLLGFSADGQGLAVIPAETLRGEKGDTGPRGLAGDMSGENNLAELTDPAVARANLDAPGRAELEEELAALDVAIRQVDLNLALNTLQDATEAGWTVLAMVDGFADVFSDKSGVDILSPAVWGDRTVGVTLSEGARLATPSASWQMVKSDIGLSSGKRYAEIEYRSVYPGAAQYALHGVVLASLALSTETWQPVGSYLLTHYGRLYANGSDAGDKRDSAFSWYFPSNYVPAGTRGCIAIDFDAGKGWLGFVNASGLPWWVGGGRPEDGANPTFNFAANTALCLAASMYTHPMYIHAGQGSFANRMLPRGFIPGWFETQGAVDGPFGVNVAPLGMASSLYGGASPERVNDGSLNAVWVAGSTGTGSHIRIAFAEAKTVVRGVLRVHYNGISYMTAIHLEGSNDAVTWITLASRAMPAVSGGDYIFDVEEPAAYLHYQLRADYSSVNALGIAEFQLYEAVTAVDTVMTETQNAVYDAVADGFFPSFQPEAAPLAGETIFHSGMGYGGDPALVFDGNTETYGASDAYGGSAIGAYAGQQFASPQRIAAVRWYRGSTAHEATGIQVIHSDDGSNWTVAAVVSGKTALGWVDIPVDTMQTGPHTHWAVRLNSGRQDGSNWPVGLTEIQFLAAKFDPMLLASKAMQSDEEPGEARAVILADPIEPVTPNTDLICEISRDDGTTWTAASLTREIVFESGRELLVTDMVALDELPGGTDMRLRIRLPTGRLVLIKGWVLQWR